MEWLLGFVYAALLVFILYRVKFFQEEGLAKYIFPLIFVFKCIVGITYSYLQLNANKGGDMFWYMYETNFLFDSCKQQPVLFFKYVFGIEDEATRVFTGIITTWNKPDFLVNDARTLLRVNLFIRLISLGAWQVHTVVFCFMSTIGFVYFTKFFAKIFNANKTAITLAVALTPSVFLWTSLILKESLLVFFLGVFLCSLHQVITEKTNAKMFTVAFVFFLLLFTVKSFVILVMIPFLIAFYICTGMQSLRWILLRWSVVLSFFWLIAVVVGNISNDYSAPYRLYMQQQSSLKFAVFRGDKSYHKPPIIASCWSSIVKRSPQAMFEVLTIPSIKSANTIEKKVAAVENILVVILFFSSVFAFIKTKQRNYNTFIFCTLFVVTFFAIVGLTTAVEGAMVRYKIAGMIFLAAIFGSMLTNKLEVKVHGP